MLQEMEVLQMRLKDLEDQRSSPTGSLAVTKRKNTMLRECVRSHQLSLATSQCVISRLLVQHFDRSSKRYRFCACGLTDVLL